MSEASRGRLVERTAGAFGLMLIAAVTSIVADTGTASARVGDTRTLPYFYGTGSVSYTRYWGGTVRWDYQGGSYCLYVQYKHVAILGLDATWNRLTADDCGGGPYSANFYKPTDRPFNGMKFRLCQNKPYVADPCGSDVTIYN